MYLLAIVLFSFIPILRPFFMGMIIVLLLFIISSALPFDLLHVNKLKLHLSIMLMLIFTFLYILMCQPLPYVFYLWRNVFRVLSRFYKYSQTFYDHFMTSFFSNIIIFNLQAMYFDVGAK